MANIINIDHGQADWDKNENANFKAINDDQQYKSLQSGTDLFTLFNNIGQTGYYLINTNEGAKNIINSPVSTAFNLITRPISSTQPLKSNGLPAWNYTLLELRPFNQE